MQLQYTLRYLPHSQPLKEIIRGKFIPNIALVFFPSHGKYSVMVKISYFKVHMLI